MTPDDLNDTLDAMAEAANGDPDRMPGLITVQTDAWINRLGAVRAKAASLQDGLRHRDIRIEIASTNATAVLSRAEAGDRGEPHRDLSPRA
jgi:hypothetical protein